MGETERSWRFVRRRWPVVTIGILVLGVVGLVGLVWFIESSANAEARAAQREFSGDKVEALVQFVESEHHSLRDRNRAVWAIGRLRDRRALVVLQRHYTGGECNHDKFLCQYELRKAIRLCSGHTSSPAWLERTMRWAVAHS